MRTIRRRSCFGSSSPSAVRTRRTRAPRVRVAVQPASIPPTTAAGPPWTAVSTMRSRRPLTGSAVKSTPPQAARRNGCTSTAIFAAPCGTSVPGMSSGAPVSASGPSSPEPAVEATACRADARTCATALRKFSQPRTPSTEVNSPAMECSAPSSATEDERTTSGLSPCRVRRSHSDSGGLPRSGQAVVSTKPSRTGMPCAAARARAAAFAPVRAESWARGSRRETTPGC